MHKLKQKREKKFRLFLNVEPNILNLLIQPKIYNFKTTDWVDKILVKKNNDVVVIYRNNIKD